MKKLIAAISALVVSISAGSQAHSQEESLTVEDISPVVMSFEVIARNFAEYNFRFGEISHEAARSIRLQVCMVLNTPNGHESVKQIIDKSERVLVKIADSQDRGQGIQEAALNGGSFSSFLDKEREELRQHLELSGNAQELLLQLFLLMRPHVVSYPVELDRDYLGQARDKVPLLCDDAHSPALNESHGGWWSWLASGFKFVGGLVIAGADIAIQPLRLAVGPMSTRFGIGAARAGGWELYVLFTDPGSQERSAGE